ncbi:15768_t:CDS:2 [Cetraspora pellucida]|uniref:15768_t:CDS:1 n=1 Tax=Cetraspora pellucida TaxID=1433469 RepID=A0A9N8ZCP7_9GLOM|nr:15768_t:CDS:2 [Cetraspora pellucida]
MTDAPVDIVQYLSTVFSILPTSISIVRLTGGEINYVYRVSFDQPIEEFAGARSVVIKISSGTLASLPEVKFGLERQMIEARAMAFLAPTSTGISLPLSHPNPYPHVMTPSLYHYSPQNNIIIMQDMGSHPDLQQFLLDRMTTNQDACALGELLGSYLSYFHTFTKDNITMLTPYFINNAARTLLQDVFYSAVTPIISLTTLSASQIAQLTEKARLLGIQGTLDQTSSTKVVKMGDLWPGAILIPRSRKELIILDWEFCDIGNPAIEVGHFITFLYLLANFPPNEKGTIEGMTNASIFMKRFLQKYTENFVPKNANSFWEDMQTMIGVDILVEAGKGRWCSIESCSCEGGCLHVEEEGAEKRKICVKKIVDVGIKLLEGRKEVLEKILCMELNVN